MKLTSTQTVLRPQLKTAALATENESSQSRAHPHVEGLDRFERASMVLQNPESFAPPTQGFLDQSFDLAKKVALSMVSGLLMVDIPQPISKERAIELGKAEVAQAKQEFGVCEDPERAARLRKASDLAIKALAPEFSLNELVVLDTDVKKGSSTSDNSILVSRALVDSATDNELLFVVGHEIGHLIEKDDAQRLAIESKLNGHLNSQGEVGTLRGKLLEEKLRDFHHHAEFGADEYGLRALTGQGLGAEAGISYFFSRPELEADFTHPGDRDRVSRLAQKKT